MKRLFVVAALIALSGCAIRTENTGVIQRGGGVYTVAHQAPTGYHSTAPLKNSTAQEAVAYCEKNGKKFEYLHSKEINGAMGVYPEVELTFRCI
jgi:hypothetical protein